MFKHLLLALLFSCFGFISCQSDSNSKSADSNAQEVNPPATGFNFEDSDSQAIKIADEVMNAMGGRKNWNQTHYLSWSFFGARQHYWDRYSGNVRIESPKDSTVFLLNIHSLEGKVQKNGRLVEDPDTLKQYLQKGKNNWINDSYWLVMPFKLKDSGVTLKYAGEKPTEKGEPADVLQLTFDKVGITPQNKYAIYVDKESRLVTQWSYFPTASDTIPGFTTPWENYEKKGAILLSGGRGKNSLSDIAVYDELPESVFTSFEPVK
jgi:hypothetical protein